MSDPFDDLEQELGSMRPRGLSPLARGRIAARLSKRKRRVGWTIAGVTAAAAAVVIGLIAWQTPPERPGEQIAQRPAAPPTVEKAAPQLLASEFDESMPSLWVYRRAAGRSLDNLDALLSRHGRTPMGSGAWPMPGASSLRIRSVPNGTKG